MNLRFVEAFYWAVTLKSVTRAAEKLHVTHSAMSSRIAALEDERGVLLLDRRDKQFRLTIAGTRFHRHAERLLKDGEYLRELAAKGMKIHAAAESLKRELQTVGERMTADWLASAGADGKAVIDAYRQ